MSRPNMPGKVARAHRWARYAKLPHGSAFWRPWSAFDLVLERRLAAALARHLARGGTVVELYVQGETEWRTRDGGNGPFIQPRNADAAYVARHLANRAVGFGFGLRLAR